MDLSGLLNVSTSAPLSTVVKVCPEGEMKMLIDDSDKWLTFKDGDASKNLSPQLVIMCNVIDERAKTFLGRDKVLVPKTIWLDTTANGQLDLSEGKNVDLGRLLAIFDLNTPGNQLEKVNSLRGKGPFIGKVHHRADTRDATIKYAEVRKVTKLT